MVADIIIVAVIVLFTIIGVRRGIARTILGIVGLFVTYAVAGGLSKWLSPLIYNSFLKQTVTENVNNYLSSYGFDYLLDNSISALPEWIRWLVSLFGGSAENVTQYVSQTVSSAQTNAAQAITQTLESLAVSALQIVLMIVLFIIVYIIVRKLIKLVSKVFKAPVLRQVNGFFGGVLGAVNGLLIVWIAVNVFCFIAQMTGNDIISNELIDGTLFRLFSHTA